MYIHVTPGQGLTTPRGWNFYVNRNILTIWSFVASFKKNLFEVWFYAIFFMILYMYIAPGQGQTAPRGQSFKSKEMSSHFIHLMQVLKKCLGSLILYNLFYDLIHVYRPRGKGKQPPGDKIWMSTERHYHFTHLLQVSKKSLWSLILYIFFFSWFNTYI